eukprot:gene1583-4729_t
MPTLLKRTFRHTWMRVCFFIIVLLTHHNDKHLTCAHDLEETICHPPCQNGGHCHIKHEVALCSCSKGFHGKLCERMTVYYEDFTVKPQGYIRGNWNTTVAGWDVYITTPMSSRATLGVIRHSDFGALEVRHIRKGFWTSPSFDLSFAAEARVVLTFSDDLPPLGFHAQVYLQYLTKFQPEGNETDPVWTTVPFDKNYFGTPMVYGTIPTVAVQVRLMFIIKSYFVRIRIRSVHIYAERADTLHWMENFRGQIGLGIFGKHSKFPSHWYKGLRPKWYIQPLSEKYEGNPTSYFKVKEGNSTPYSGVMEAYALQHQVAWTTKPILIMNYDEVRISIQASSSGYGLRHDDAVVLAVRLDHGPWQIVDKVSGASHDFDKRSCLTNCQQKCLCLSQSLTSGPLFGNTLQIQVRVRVNSSDDVIRFDDVMVHGIRSLPSSNISTVTYTDTQNIMLHNSTSVIPTMEAKETSGAQTEMHTNPTSQPTVSFPTNTSLPASSIAPVQSTRSRFSYVNTSTEASTSSMRHTSNTLSTSTTTISSPPRHLRIYIVFPDGKDKLASVLDKNLSDSVDWNMMLDLFTEGLDVALSRVSLQLGDDINVFEIRKDNDLSTILYGSSSSIRSIVFKVVKNGEFVVPVSKKINLRARLPPWMRSNCVWQWSSWTRCSSKCSVGFQVRWKIILHPAQHGGTPCPKFSKQYRKCFGKDPSCTASADTTSTTTTSSITSISQQYSTLTVPKVSISSSNTTDIFTTATSSAKTIDIDSTSATIRRSLPPNTLISTFLDRQSATVYRERTTTKTPSYSKGVTSHSSLSTTPGRSITSNARVTSSIRSSSVETTKTKSPENTSPDTANILPDTTLDEVETFDSDTDEPPASGSPSSSVSAEISPAGIVGIIFVSILIVSVVFLFLFHRRLQRTTRYHFDQPIFSAPAESCHDFGDPDLVYENEHLSSYSPFPFMESAVQEHTNMQNRNTLPAAALVDFFALRGSSQTD